MKVNKGQIKYLVIFIWMILWDYMGDILNLSKNIYYFLLYATLLLAGIALIFFLFDKGFKKSGQR
jgi:hypothetical protein